MVSFFNQWFCCQDYNQDFVAKLIGLIRLIGLECHLYSVMAPVRTLARGDVRFFAQALFVYLCPRVGWQVDLFGCTYVRYRNDFDAAS